MDRVLSDKALLGRSGFATGSALYERARPGYSDDAVAHLLGSLGIGAGSRVLDVAAGTGKLTRALVAAGAEAVASEPSGSMREVFTTSVPGTPQIACTAEQLGVADGSFDAVTVAQAFHWFDAPVALAEFARVLRPGGGLGLVWNERDESDPVVAELTRISKWDIHQPYPVGMDFGPVIDASERFGPVDAHPAPVHPGTRPHGFRRAGGSRSYIAVLPDDRRQRSWIGWPIWRRRWPNRSASPTSPTCSVRRPLTATARVCQRCPGEAPCAGSRARGAATTTRHPGEAPTMIKLTCLLRRKEGLTPAEFHAYWRDHHGPLIASSSAARYVIRYEQNPRPLDDYRDDDDRSGYVQRNGAK